MPFNLFVAILLSTLQLTRFVKLVQNRKMREFSYEQYVSKMLRLMHSGTQGVVIVESVLIDHSLRKL